jgi:MFS family permease
MESLGFFLPSIYLPSYAASLSLSPALSTLVLSVLNSCSVIGAITLGYATDRLPVNTVIAISSIGATISVFLLWGLATSLPLLVIFAAVYGVFAGGFSALWIGMAREVLRDFDGDAGIITLMGAFSAGRGIGAVLSGPMSEILLKRNLGSEVFRAYGSEYGVLIVFTGISAFCGLVCYGAMRRSSA